MPEATINDSRTSGYMYCYCKEEQGREMVCCDDVENCPSGRGEAIMLVELSIILFSNSHNFTYYAHKFYLLFSKLCLV